MPASTRKSPFAAGFLQGLPFVAVIVPFGMLFGVVGTEAGMDLAQVMAMTVLVIAGASQFTAVQLMTDNAPVLLVLAASLTVNLRMAMYSASLAPYLGAAPVWKRALVAYMLVDQCYAASILRYESRPGEPVAARVAFYFGVASPVVPLWYLSTWFGAVLGTAIPEGLALDFAVPITFLALLGPALRTLPHVVAALVSAVMTLAFAWMPTGLGLMVAAVLAMGAGAATELWQDRQR
ncbi:AzlC family ABC transporter permease [Palleronia rufa]|uniref:AzlC family ABC transporter permease n=1 Tax=Palleronia rufa TaxID=1530186 RepID=UPI0005608108|nr:AzlC family ABC transporter permease [Palleronia rufa]